MTASPRDAIELWLVDLESCCGALASLETETPRLAVDERGRAEGIGDPRDRSHRLAAYTAQRILLERFAGPSVRGRAFQRTTTGKPRLDGAGVAFSLSHVDGLALIGVAASAPLGVDLERVRPARLAARRLDEISAIGAGLADKPLPSLAPERAFLQAWARLEAFAKASGLGVAATLTGIGLRGRRGPPLSLPDLEASARRMARRQGLIVHDVTLSSALHGAVGVPRGTRAVRARHFPADRAAITRLLAP